jgi:anti-anti-sigma factor
MSEVFAVTGVDRHGRAVVFLSGEIDIAAAEQIRNALLKAQSDSAAVIVDVSRVTFIDSSGINALLRARERVPNGGEIHVVGARPNIRSLFEITGIDDLLLDETPGFTWQQVTHHRNGWRQWMTAERTEEGVPIAEIVEVEPWAGADSNASHYLLEMGSQTGVYASLTDAMRAAEDPESVAPLKKRTV